VLRDPTRGGLATTLNEIAVQSGVSILVEEKSVPVLQPVRAACEMLGFDPLYIANEGKVIVITPADEAEAALAALRSHHYGRSAARIGVVQEAPLEEFCCAHPSEHPHSGCVVRRTSSKNLLTKNQKKAYSSRLSVKRRSFRTMASLLYLQKFISHEDNMKIDYQETTNDLLTRIDIHNKFGGRNIDEWMLEVLNLQKGVKILDVGCGAGKQCFSFFKHLDGDADITGGDFSEELLGQARKENATTGDRVHFTELDFNKRFPFEDNQFDLTSCCFAIYYAEDIPFTIREMHRVLKPGGRLFTTGPMPENKQTFYDIIREATGKTNPAHARQFSLWQ
jgi:ubiquinone/menaquinone biosynthesis C-methylase UbiE